MKTLNQYIVEGGLIRRGMKVNTGFHEDIVLDDLTNDEIEKIADNLNDLCYHMTGLHIGPYIIEMSFKDLYDFGIVIRRNDIWFEKVSSKKAVMVVNFENGDLEKGPHYYDDEDGEWKKWKI